MRADEAGEKVFRTAKLSGAAARMKHGTRQPATKKVRHAYHPVPDIKQATRKSLVVTLFATPPRPTNPMRIFLKHAP